MGGPAQRLHGLEAGKREPPFADVCNQADTLGVNLDEFRGEACQAWRKSGRFSSLTAIPSRCPPGEVVEKYLVLLLVAPVLNWQVRLSFGGITTIASQFKPARPAWSRITLRSGIRHAFGAHSECRFRGACQSAVVIGTRNSLLANSCHALIFDGNRGWK